MWGKCSNYKSLDAFPNVFFLISEHSMLHDKSETRKPFFFKLIIQNKSFILHCVSVTSAYSYLKYLSVISAEIDSIINLVCHCTANRQCSILDHQIRRTRERNIFSMNFSINISLSVRRTCSIARTVVQQGCNIFPPTMLSH
jgi:hypothetical protein